MRLVGAVTEGSGATNEDGWGVIQSHGRVEAAWIFDGVTGINGKNLLPAPTDAAWLVKAADAILRNISGQSLPLKEIATSLVSSLIAAWQRAVVRIDIPSDYDPPAACLILVKRYAEGWRALRLGDSCLLARSADSGHKLHLSSPNNDFDHWLAREAAERRKSGETDVKALLQSFRPQLLKSRGARNRPDGYSILEASDASLALAEFIDLGNPSEMLLCTDGYFRAVDHYGLCTAEELLQKSCQPGGVDIMLRRLRNAEAEDPDCERYPRFKPADDATAVALVAGGGG